MQKNHKRGQCQGFDGVTGERTAKRIKLWAKNEVGLNWRKWALEKIRYTTISKTLSYGDKSWCERFIAPYGMKDSIRKRKGDTRGKSSLSDDAKEALCLPDNYNPKDIKIITSDDGDLGFKEFYVVLCQKCHFSDNGYLKYFVDKYKDFLPADPKISNIMDNWDKIVGAHASEMKYMDVVGCILPHEPTLNACPNERKYITRPVEHADSKCHKLSVKPTNVAPSPGSTSNIETVGEASSVSRKKSSSSLTSPTTIKKQKLLTVAVDGTVTAEKSVKVKNIKKPGKENTTITVKHQKKLVFKPINSMLDPTVSLYKNPTSQLEKDAQNSCYSFVLSGCSKEISNNTTIEFYGKHVFHLRKHHQETVGHLQFDNKVLPKPLRTQLDKNNITNVHAALVESYKQMNSSSANPVLYKPFIEDGAPVCIYTDGIQKFGKELNGAYARTADKDLSITNAPISLHSIQGGSMNKEKLAVELISVINETKPVPLNDSAFTSFIRDDLLCDENRGPLSPPEYFKCCTIISQDSENRSLELLFPHWPVCITADGCRTNAAAVDLLVEKVGILSPRARCSAHAAHGSMRRMASSKTMSVQEVVEYATNIRPVLKHFKNSGKSLSILNDALKLLEMKPMKAMTWSPTRMGYLLTSSKRCTELLVPLSDVLVSCDIKKEEASYFLSPKCLGIMHLLADVEEVFMKGFIRRLDGDKSLIIDVFNESTNAISAIEGLEMKSFNSFLEGLSEDDWGNIILSTKTSTSDSHILTLNYTHYQGRRAAESKIEKIKREAVELKDKVLENLKQNIQEQNQADSIVEFASCFDMTRKISCEERIELLMKLHSIYGVDYIHEVEDQNEFGIAGWDIKIKYQAKIQCSSEDLVSQFKTLWPKMNKEWCAWKKDSAKQGSSAGFWKHMLEQYAYLCCELFELIMIVMAISPGTGPLERSFSKLEKICKKDRNQLAAKSIENLWLLAIYQLNDDDVLFDGVRKMMSNKE